MQWASHPPAACEGWIPTGLQTAYISLGRLTTTGAPFFIRENTRAPITCVTGPKDACIPLIDHLLHIEMHLQRSVLLFGVPCPLPHKILSPHPPPTEWNLHAVSYPFPGDAILPSVLGDILASGIGDDQKDVGQTCTLRGICALIIRKIRAKGMILNASSFLQILEDPIRSAPILKESTNRFRVAWNRLSQETQATLKDTLQTWDSPSSTKDWSSWIHGGELAFLSTTDPIHTSILLRRLPLLKSTTPTSPLLSFIFLSPVDPILVDHLLKFPHTRILIWHPQPPTYSHPFHEIRHIATLRRQSIFRYLPNPSSLQGMECIL